MRADRSSGRLRGVTRSLAASLLAAAVAAACTQSGPTPTPRPSAPPPAAPPSAAVPGLWSVTAFGARGDAVHDDTAAFQRAVDAAGAAGGSVLVPPLPGGRGYVIAGTVRVPAAVSLIGGLAGFGNNVEGPIPEAQIKGSKILARPSALHQPLFQLERGTTVRGLWISYDQQPMPSDQEFQDPSSPFHYPSFAAARAGFVRDHVKADGPTFYIPTGANVVVEDIVADRYYDFLYLKAGARLQVDRLQLYGYERGFVIEDSRDVDRLSHVLYVPASGPVPFGRQGDRTWSWIYGIIASQPGNVVIQAGRADGWELHDIYIFGAHTGIQIGASAAFPIVDPVSGSTFTDTAPNTGPWGQLSNIGLDQTVVGLHFVWPDGIGTQIADLEMYPGLSDGSLYRAATGSGDLRRVAAQAAFLFEPTFSEANAGPLIPSVLASNVSVFGVKDAAHFAGAAATPSEANGRLFLVGGDLSMEISSLSTLGYDARHLLAAAPTAGAVSIRVRGYLNAGRPQSDLRLDKSGVRSLP